MSYHVHGPLARVIVVSGLAPFICTTLGGPLALWFSGSPVSSVIQWRLGLPAGVIGKCIDVDNNLLKILSTLRALHIHYRAGIILAR